MGMLAPITERMSIEGADKVSYMEALLKQSEL